MDTQTKNNKSDDDNGNYHDDENGIIMTNPFFHVNIPKFPVQFIFLSRLQAIMEVDDSKFNQGAKYIH